MPFSPLSMGLFCMHQRSNIGLFEGTAFISEIRIDVTFHLFHVRAQGGPSFNQWLH